MDDFEQITEWMQCIGIRDINGSLIFDGDLIKSSFTHIIMWSRYEDTGNQHNYGRMAIGYNFGVHDYLCKAKIVGNIFENIDMVEESDIVRLGENGYDLSGFIE